MTIASGKEPLFNPGEAADERDWNDVMAVGTQRAWEWPGYSNILNLCRLYGQTYGAGFANNGLVGGRSIAWTRGAGLFLSASTFTTSIDAGFIGKYTDTAPPSVLSLPAGATRPKMRWGYINNGDVSLVHDASPAGQTRYDLIEVDIAEADGDSDTRHFRDATTLAYSSASLDKRKIMTPSFTIKKGTDSGGTPTVPSLTSGRALVAIVLVDENSVVTIHDATVPWGEVRAWSAPPARNYSLLSGWTANADGTLTAAANGDSVLVTCPFPGDPTVRIIGVEVRHTITGGGSGVIRMAQYSYGDGAAPSLGDLVTTFTGSIVTSSIALMGSPIVAGGMPVWAHGNYKKAVVPTVPGYHAALQVVAGAASDKLWGVSFLYVRG